MRCKGLVQEELRGASVTNTNGEVPVSSDCQHPCLARSCLSLLNPPLLVAAAKQCAQARTPSAASAPAVGRDA